MLWVTRHLAFCRINGLLVVENQSGRNFLCMIDREKIGKCCAHEQDQVILIIWISKWILKN